MTATGGSTAVGGNVTGSHIDTDEALHERGQGVRKDVAQTILATVPPKVTHPSGVRY